MPDCVLNVSADAALRDIRFRLLSNAGFSVVSVNSVASGEAVLRTEKCIHAMVLCETVTVSERKELVRIAKQEGIPIIMVGAVKPEERALAHAIVDRLEDPSLFLKRVVDAVQAGKRASK